MLEVRILGTHRPRACPGPSGSPAENVGRRQPCRSYIQGFVSGQRGAPSDRIKILYWDRDGFALWSKRLEEGTYAVPFGDGGAERRREITAQELAALLSGIDLERATRRKRYRRST
jgi:transposase